VRRHADERNRTILLCETDFFTLTDASRTEADGFFDEGMITFTMGLRSVCRSRSRPT
jgi:hypothetical protein